MSTFSVDIVRIEEGAISHHPDADRLSIIKIGGYVCISAKLEDGSHRYTEGDLVIYVPEMAVVPEWLLKKGFWDSEKNRGILSGSQYNRVKAIRLRGIFSQGILFPVLYDQNSYSIEAEDGTFHFVTEGQDVAEILGIVKYEPPLKQGSQFRSYDDMVNLEGYTTKYDFDSVQKYPKIFNSEDQVVVTEKIHGTNVQIGYIPELDNPELFYDGNMYVGSKGLSAKGWVFKDNEANKDIMYVKMLNGLLVDGFGEKFTDVRLELTRKYGDVPIRIFGEIYGSNIQKGFRYGTDKHKLAIFDIQVGPNFLEWNEFFKIAEFLEIDTVPVLYIGPYIPENIVVHRDGRSSLDEKTLREGVVIKTLENKYDMYYGRKIAKWA